MRSRFLCCCGGSRSSAERLRLEEGRLASVPPRRLLLMVVGGMSPRRRRLVRSEAGMALLVVLVILVAVGTSSASFIWFMNQLQSRAGLRYRSAAAMSLAEAGVHRALSILEMAAFDGRPGREWRPIAFSEVLHVGSSEGRFTVSLTDEVDGAVMIASVGEFAGVRRGLRARGYLASPALLSALYGTGLVRLEGPPSVTFILPSKIIGDRPWIHLAAGMGVWFASPDVLLNDPSTPFDASPGPVGPLQVTGNPAGTVRPEPVRLFFSSAAELILGQDQHRVDTMQLRATGINVDSVVLRNDALPAPPEVDRSYYQDRARTNTSNADVNEAAGKYLRDSELTHKRDSLYTADQFQEVLSYLAVGPRRPRLLGIVYVIGTVSLPDGHTLEVTDGALVAENTVLVGQGASLEITHLAATRALPGLLILDSGALLVAREARLRVHGLVYVNRLVDVGEGARVSVVGSVLANDSGLSFQNSGVVTIQYDPAVLGTPGLLAPTNASVVV